MKKIATLLLVSLMVQQTAVAQTSNPVPSVKKGQFILVGGSGWDDIAIVDNANGAIVWKHTLGPGQECNSVQMTRKGDILYAHRSGATLLDRKTGAVKREFTAPQGAEMHTARELPDGNIMLAMCGHPARIWEITPKGDTVVRVAFETGVGNPHSQFRQVSKAANGNYLVPLMGRGEVWEITPQGETVRTVAVRGGLFSVQELAGGNWIVSCGDAHRFAEVDHNRDTVQYTLQLGNDMKMLFVAQMLRFENGNTLIANWGGHSRDKNQSKLFEIDAAHNAVWRLPAEADAAVGSLSAFWPIGKGWGKPSVPGPAKK